MEFVDSLAYQFQKKKKIIFNSFWVFSDRILRMAIGLFVGVWVARYLGPFNFGIYNYAISIVVIGCTLVNLGLNNIVLTDLVSKPDKGRILYTSFLAKVIAGCLMFLILCLFSFTTVDEQLTRVLLIILSVQCIFQSTDIFDIFNQSRTESRNTVIAKSTAYIIANIIKVIALLNGFSLILLGIITVFEVILASVILVYFYVKVSKQSFSTWVFDRSLAKSLLIRSWPLIFAELFVILYMRVDQLMIKNMVGNVELGQYSAAVRLAEIHYFLAMAVCSSVYPTIVKLKERGEHELLKGFQKLFNLLTTISVLVAIFITFSADFITSTLYGEKYFGVGSILAIHVWAGIFVFLGVGSSNWLIVNNLQKYLLFRTILGLVVNVVLNLVLIPRYYALGAALATLISQFVASVLANVFTEKTRPLFWMQLKSFLVFFKPSLKNYT